MIVAALDGAIDDEAWKNAIISDHFWNSDQQRWPSEQTEVLVMADKEHLYIGFRVYDRQPEAIQALQTRRGAGLGLDDQVAGVHCSTHQRKELERLCRYITRPAIANERLERNGAGDVVLQLKSAWRDGTMHIKMSPLEFMQRLAALVPRPRPHLIRFHGVLAPHAGLRAAIVPGPPHKPGDDAAHHAHEAPARMGWARLLKRVFDIDLEHCPQCGGDFKIIAAIEEPAVIVRILTHLGLPARAPPRSPAPPLSLFRTA